MKRQNLELKIVMTPAEGQTFIPHTSVYSLHPERVPYYSNACFACLIDTKTIFYDIYI